MTTLSDVLEFIGYTSLIEKIAYIRLLAYSQTKSFENNTEEKIRSKLESSFNSLEEGFLWLLKQTNESFLRPTYHKEIAADVSQPIHTSQWRYSDEVKIDETDIKKPNADLIDCLKQLHLSEACPWPVDRAIKNVVIISSLDPYVKERVNFLHDFRGNLYFVSGARGLFNNEASLAPILANWFNLPDKKDVIQTVLNKHLDFVDPENWTTLKISNLKQQILSALDQKQWCHAKNSWFYKEEKSYVAAGREKLKDWPVAMDMFEYYFNKRKNDEKIFQHVVLNHLVVQGENGQLPTTVDFLKVWYKQYANLIKTPEDIPIFIVCNYTHRIPLVQQALSTSKEFSELYRKASVIDSLINFEHNKTINDHKQQNRLCVVGPSATRISLLRCLDILARSLWLIKEKQIKEHLYKIKYNIPYTMDLKINEVLLIKKINMDGSFNNSIDLIQDCIILAFIYRLTKHFTKASVLANFARNITLTDSNTLSTELLNLLCNFIIKNTKEFVFQSHNILQCKPLLFDNSFLLKQSSINRSELQIIRNKLLNEFKNITDKEIIRYSHRCFYIMSNFLMTIISQSMDHLGIKNTEILFCYLGSNARKEATPYSDIEFFILTSNNDFVKAYAKELTKLILLKILDLGETIIRHMYIHAYDDKKHKYDLINHLFDTFTFSKRGLSFDFNHPTASKTPLGAKIDNQLIYRLIGTPREIAELASYRGHYLDDKLPQMLRQARPFLGDQKLFYEYQQELKSQEFSASCYSYYNFKRDFDKYLPLLNAANNTKPISHKDQVFRPLCVLIDDLFFSFNPTKNFSTFKKLTALFRYNIINFRQLINLEGITAFLLFIRFEQDFIHKQHVVDISLEDAKNEKIDKLRSALGYTRYLYTFFNDNCAKKENALLIAEYKISQSKIYQTAAKKYLRITKDSTEFDEKRASIFKM